MQEFYKKALLALIFLLVVDALLAVFFVYRAFPTRTLPPARKDGSGWHYGAYTNVVIGGVPSARLHDTSGDRLRFDFKLKDVVAYPIAAGDLKLHDGKGRFLQEDWSRVRTISFVVKCSLATALSFEVSTFDGKFSEPGKFETYVPPRTYFSCNEQGMPVTLDLSRLLIPEWWYASMRQDLGRQVVKLDRVGKIMFGTTAVTPRNVDAYVEISELTLHGRDDRYLAALAIIILGGWVAFGVWFFLSHSRALLASVDSKVKINLPLVAYRQLTLEPYKDKEKAAVLRYIANSYTDPKLDLETVVEGTGANRYKINEVLKSELGMTFTSYLNKLRLSEASRLLTEKSSAAVSEIAYLVGYANVPYFNKLFKEEFGCTPKSFRMLAAQQGRQEQPADRAPSEPLA
ncbi:helix-turn-helix domain-containing protein [Pseudoduganella namucuonensis]|uniref:AraC-type DNA-binding protein n=1 Tax=Pseudoduganella namucuonensis TaxID=1035707 RepID=A0A1I7J9C9_9BURK|nr:helix-turn-helix transcriptional regulator [Pseudoduganella namucuonensis]SFU81795.1 AraC-type DNA-binding protein [Pseudoduganella namucuonensis]